ncbi:MAG: type II secretion system F family protein [Candidatus Thermoplasmatota archaeon]|jgi:archaellum biogenesis protein FlaJ (TadC family)|nr:type II secretion system F family protein [Candidatus Thermoplasmatota archaeon]|tara:strand:- start:85 stop:666 length:582 start_codon:yes stop_codon:yes gene_type:complete
MRKLDEKREVLYVIRAMDVLMSSGIGLEATVHSVSQGGYGVISEDFAKMMENVRKGGRPLEKELKSLMKNVETEGYRRLLNIMHMNITQNTDIIETLKKQGTRMEEERTEDVKKYIEDLSGVPESLLSIGMIGPIILSVFGLFPQLMGGEGMGDIMPIPEQSTINVILNIGLFMTLLVMVMIGVKTHTKDPGL